MERKKGYRASYTVEAAAVVSLTFLVLGAFLIMMFFVHDRVVIQSIVCEAAAAGSNYITKEEGTAASSSVCGMVSDTRFLGSRGTSVWTQTGSDHAFAQGSAVFPVPGMFAAYFAGGELAISSEWNSEKMDPAEVIRMIRGAELVLENFESE